MENCGRCSLPKSDVANKPTPHGFERICDTCQDELFRQESNR